MTGSHDHTHSDHSHDGDDAQRWKHDGVRVIPGDRVTIAVSPYDPTHGLIVFRGG